MSGAGRARTTPKLDVLRLARSQAGVVHIAQANALGLSSDAVYRLVRSGEWASILPKVVAVDPVPGWIQRAAGACLWGGPDAAASHRTAGVLWDLEGVAPSSAVEISVPGKKSSPRPWLILHRVALMSASHRRNRIPVTNPARTLVDLAGVLPRAALELALEDALRRGLTSMPKLERTLIDEGGRGKRGCRALSQLVRERRGDGRPTESRLEARLLDVLRRAGIPRPVLQHAVTTEDGFRARLDFAYPAEMLAIEVDGYRYHSGRTAWEADRRRMSHLAVAGWRVLHVTAKDLAAGAPDLVHQLRRFVGQQTL